MHTLNIKTNYWPDKKSTLYWFKHSLLPLLLISAFLLLPQPWKLALLPTNSIIEIDIIESSSSLLETVTPTIEQPPVETVITPLSKPTIDQPTPKPQETQEQITTTASKEVQTIETQAEPQESISVKPTLKIDAGDVLQMIQNPQSINITDEFKARTAPAKDFYIPEQEIYEWFEDIPYLDESVDKPQLKMKFYAEGIEGNIEKFFDKITVKKTFTTKYGTKINCALVGILVACCWK